MELIDVYLKDVCRFIKNKKACFEIEKELRNHINELAQMYMKRGISQKEAIDKALKSIGDSEELGRELNQVHKEKFDIKLIIIILILGVIGFVGVCSFNNFIANSMNRRSLDSFVINDLIWVSIGVIFFFIGYKWRIESIKKTYIIMYALGCILILGSKSFENFEPNFMGIPILSIVPICFLFSISTIYEKFSINTNKQKILLLILEVIPLFLIVYKTEYIPIYLCYSIALILIIYINNKNLKNIIIPIILELIIFIEIGFKYMATINSNSKLVTTILETSKIVGRNNHVNPFINLNLPIVSIIGNYGILFGILIIIGLVYFAFRMMKSSSSIKNRYYKSLAYIIGTIISVQIILSILVNLNLLNIQIKTILISSGGIYFVITLFLLGIFNNIYRYKNISIIK